MAPDTAPLSPNFITKTTVERLASMI